MVGKPVWPMMDEEKCGVSGVLEGEDEEQVFCTDSEADEVTVGMAKQDWRERLGEAEDVGKLKAKKDERVVKELVDPRRPSEREVREQKMIHLPDRNWCENCIKAKGKDWDHRKDLGKERGLSE